MKTPVQTIAPNALASYAQAEMRRLRIRHFIVTQGKDIVGVVSSTDVAGADPNATIASIMSEGVVTAEPETTVRKAANLLRGRIVGCLPIIDRGKPVGIVTISDLLELLGRGAERPIPETTRRTLSRRGPRKARPSQDRQGLVYSR